MELAMHLSKKGEYAIRALTEFGIEAVEHPGGLLQIATVAARTKVPEKFLEQILLALKNAGLLVSKRGVDGGYRLNREPEEIVLGEVIRLLDGPLAPVPCVSQSAFEPCNCPDPDTCGLRLSMQKVRDAISGILDDYPLSRLVDEVQQKRRERNATMQFDI